MKKKILTLSTDQKIFDENSEVRQRMIEYGSVFEELHIVIYTKHNLNITNKMQLSENVWAYPTNSASRIFYFLDAHRIAKKIIHNSSFLIHNSIVTTQDPFETGLVGYWLKKKYNIPLQIQVHTDIFSPYFWKESFKNKIRVLLAKWLLPKADKIRVVSQRIKDSILRSSKDPGSFDDQNIAVLPIFVDVEKIKTAPIKTDLHKKYPNYDFIILMASRLTKEKNIALALEAFSKVKCQMSDVKCLLLIVGDGPEHEALQLQITNYQLQNNVVIESAVDHQTLFSYYKTADLFLLTSNYEGYGRTIIEAMTVGLPIIMTDVGLAGEFFKNDVNGKIIAINDKNRLISVLNDMIKNKEKLKEFGQNNEKAVSRLITKEEYLKKYESNT